MQKYLARAGKNFAKYTGCRIKIKPFQFAIICCTLLQQRNGFFMQIITQFFMSPQQYVNEFDSLQISRPEKCPSCGLPNAFHRHGRYWRNIITDQYEERIPVARFCCKSCSLTVSVLPSFLLPRFQYSLACILTALNIIFATSSSLTALQRFYRRRFYRNSNRIAMFFREQMWQEAIPADKKEKARKLVCMLTVPTVETISQRFHQQYKRHFMAR